MNFGDIVRVNGYWPRVFQIDSYRIESHFEPGVQWNETVYELTDVANGEWVEADLVDLTLVVPAEKAAEYLEAMKPTEQYTLMEGVSYVKPKEPRKPTARELSAQEAERRKAERKVIDRLLDEFNDYKRLADEFGDEEYKARVEYLAVKLAEFVEK